MTLSVIDRLVLLNVLPAQGDITALRIVRKLREDLSFDEAEHAALGLHLGDVQPREGCEACGPQCPTGQAHWRTSVAQDRDVEIGPRASQIIADAMKRLNEQGQLRQEHIALFERFVEK